MAISEAKETKMSRLANKMTGIVFRGSTLVYLIKTILSFAMALDEAYN